MTIIGLQLYAQSVALDQTFGNGGRLLFAPNAALSNNAATDVHVLADDRVLTLGVAVLNGSNLALVNRAMSHGDADTTFGDQGYFLNTTQSVGDHFHDIHSQAGGKVILAGERFDPSVGNSVLLLRLTNDGNIDATFGQNGVFVHRIGNGISTVGEVTVLNDGRIVVVGTLGNDAFALGVTVNGSLDNNFGVNGLNVLPNNAGMNTGIFVESDPLGRILVGSRHGLSSTSDGHAITRLLSNGQIDLGYGFNGTLLVDELPNGLQQQELLMDMTVDRHGNLYLCASHVSNSPASNTMVISKLDDQGELATGFSTSGRYTLQMDPVQYAVPTCIAVNSQEEIMVAGNQVIGTDHRYFIIRLDAQGIPIDPTGFGVMNSMQQPQPWQVAAITGGIAVQSTGRTVLTASFQQLNDGLVALLPFVATGASTLEGTETEPLLYPMPTRDVFRLSPAPGPRGNVELLDLHGRILQSWAPGASSFRCMRSLPTGNYLVRVVEENRALVLPLHLER